LPHYIHEKSCLRMQSPASHHSNWSWRQALHPCVLYYKDVCTISRRRVFLTTTLFCNRRVLIFGLQTDKKTNQWLIRSNARKVNCVGEGSTVHPSKLFHTSWIRVQCDPNSTVATKTEPRRGMGTTARCVYMKEDDTC
jgi:hypothetical protein